MRIIPKEGGEVQEIGDSGYHPTCVLYAKGGKNGIVFLTKKVRKGKGTTQHAATLGIFNVLI